MALGRVGCREMRSGHDGCRKRHRGQEATVRPGGVISDLSPPSEEKMEPTGAARWPCVWRSHRGRGEQDTQEGLTAA